MLDLVKENRETFLPVFCHKPAQITREEMASLFVPSLSERGSNRHRRETSILALWNDFLIDIEGRIHRLYKKLCHESW